MEILANIKSAKKRVLVSRLRQERNKARRTEMRTMLRRARAEEATTEQLQTATISVARAASKGLIHKNKAARLKSQLSKKQNALASN